MSEQYGMRVDVGQEIKPGIVLYSVCEYACIRTDGFYCPYFAEYTKYLNEYPYYTTGKQYCQCPGKSHISDKICYATQTTEMYIQDHHVINLNGKEVRIMDLKSIKEARRTPDGNCVAVDDIVDVKLGYISKSLVHDIVKSNCSFTGRISSFESNVIVFDLSTLYRASSVDLYYTDIISMKVHEEKQDANCN